MGQVGTGRDEEGHNEADQRARRTCVVIGCNKERVVKRFCEDHKGRAPVYPDHLIILDDDGEEYAYTRGLLIKNKSNFIRLNRWYVIHNKDKYENCDKCKKPHNYDVKGEVHVKTIHGNIYAFCNACSMSFNNKLRAPSNYGLRKGALKHVEYMKSWKNAQRMEGLKSRYCTR